MNAVQRTDEPDEDGALIPALSLLADAVHRLCGPQSRFMDGKLMYSESRYLQLQDHHWHAVSDDTPKEKR